MPNANDSTTRGETFIRSAIQAVLLFKENPILKMEFLLDIGIQLLVFFFYLGEALVYAFYKKDIEKKLKLQGLSYEKSMKIYQNIPFACLGSFITFFLSICMYFVIGKKANHILLTNNINKAVKGIFILFIVDLMYRTFGYLFRPTIDTSVYQLFYMITHCNVENFISLTFALIVIYSEPSTPNHAFLFVPNLIKFTSKGLNHYFFSKNNKDFLVAKSGYVSKKFLESLDEISKTYSFDIDRVVLSFSNSIKPKIVTKGVNEYICIPHRLISTIDEDALIGYIASAMAFCQKRYLALLDNISLCICVIINFVAFYLIRNIRNNNLSKNFFGILGMFRAIATVEFFATLLFNGISRVLENNTDALVKKNGYAENLIKYLIQSDQKSKLLRNNYFSKVLEIFSYYNSYNRRIDRLSS